MRDIITPTIFTIAFIACTGIYGFFKFSREHTSSAHVNVVVNSEEPSHMVSTGSIPLDYDDFEPSPYLRMSMSDYPHPAVHSDRPLITYSYTESPSARDNLIFFLGNGLHDFADFIFILNGPTDVAKLIPTKINIQVVARPDECFGLVAHGEVLRTDDLWKKYSRFVMLDATIRGPFLPYYSHICWNNVFLDRVTENVKLVGMAADCLPQYHLQSMIWATDYIGMELLLCPPEGLSVPEVYYDSAHAVTLSEEKERAILCEVECTAAIKQAGYKTDVLMTAFREFKDDEGICTIGPIKDVLWDTEYSIANLHPYETVFVKADLYTDSIPVARLTEWHQSRNMNGSWKKCYGHMSEMV
ncbi:hypothetical protein F4677DRAFT_466083 [Hypoxylon crocopeplum]|nr:hypothetical protein F4677DRAFT_466083 [Hypoxylon crocopeplum]